MELIILEDLVNDLRNLGRECKIDFYRGHYKIVGENFLIFLIKDQITNMGILVSLCDPNYKEKIIGHL